jgi:hypothetical protein
VSGIVGLLPIVQNKLNFYEFSFLELIFIIVLVTLSKIILTAKLGTMDYFCNPVHLDQITIATGVT